VQRFANLGQHVKEFVEKRTVHYKWYVYSSIYPSVYLRKYYVPTLRDSSTTNQIRLRGDVVFVPEVPKSPAGKILRRMLKDVKGGVPVTIYPAKQVELAKL